MEASKEEMKKKGVDLSEEEAARLEQCFKDKEFRGIFGEYLKEISDPKNKKEYEEYISQLERGETPPGAPVPAGSGKAVVVRPRPWLCLKTRRKAGGAKVFVNVCHAEPLEAAHAERGKGGQSWSIPHTAASARKAADNAGAEVDVVDVVFGTTTKAIAAGTPRLHDLLVQTALEAASKKLGAELDGQATKQLRNHKFKGGEPPAVSLRREGSGDAAAPAGVQARSPEAMSDAAAARAARAPEDRKQTERERKEEETAAAAGEGPTEPKHRVVERGTLELEDFEVGSLRDVPASRRPRELVVRVDLPRADSMAGLDVDVTDRALSLTTENRSYALELRLPYPVDSDRGAAKFNRKKRQLVVTLPVRPVTREEAQRLVREHRAAVEARALAAEKAESEGARAAAEVAAAEAKAAAEAEAKAAAEAEAKAAAEAEAKAAAEAEAKAAAEAEVKAAAEAEAKAAAEAEAKAAAEAEAKAASEAEAKAAAEAKAKASVAEAEAVPALTDAEQREEIARLALLELEAAAAVPDVGDVSFEARQSVSLVVLRLDVPGADHESVVVETAGPRRVRVSLAAGADRRQYRREVLLHGDVSASGHEVDTSDANVVVRLRKSEEGMWDVDEVATAAPAAPSPSSSSTLSQGSAKHVHWAESLEQTRVVKEQPSKRADKRHRRVARRRRSSERDEEDDSAAALTAAAAGRPALSPLPDPSKQPAKSNLKQSPSSSSAGSASPAHASASEIEGMFQFASADAARDGLAPEDRDLLEGGDGDEPKKPAAGIAQADLEEWRAFPAASSSSFGSLSALARAPAESPAERLGIQSHGMLYNID